MNFCVEFLTNEKAPRHYSSLIIGRDLWKNSQNNLSLHLPLTLHLKTPTQRGKGGGCWIKKGRGGGGGVRNNRDWLDRIAGCKILAISIRQSHVFKYCLLILYSLKGRLFCVRQLTCIPLYRGIDFSFGCVGLPFLCGFLWRRIIYIRSRICCVFFLADFGMSCLNI